VQVAFANFTFKRMQNSPAYRRTPMTTAQTHAICYFYFCRPRVWFATLTRGGKQLALINDDESSGATRTLPLPLRLSTFLQYFTASFKDGIAMSVRITGILYYFTWSRAPNTIGWTPRAKYHCYALFGNNLYRGRLRV